MSCRSLYCNIRVLYMITILALIQRIYVSGQQYEGDDCDLDGTPGKCTLIDNCLDVLRNISSKRPMLCGFAGSISIICCPKVQRNETLKIDNEVVAGTKAKEKCIEYSAYIYEWELPDNETDPEKKVRVNRCGHIANAFVIGQDVTAPREYPHMAILGIKRKDETRQWICGGTLISEQFVLTAAHCADSSDGELRWVRLGEHSIDMYKESETQEFGVDDIIRHPDYRSLTDNDDIALLKLDRKVILNKFVIPACLHTEFDIEQKTAVATGWGRESYWDRGTSFDLSKVVLDILTNGECNSPFFITRSMICAGHRIRGRGLCQADSGGPLQVYLKTPYCMYDVIGVLSFGSKLCGYLRGHEVFMRVSHYVGWIESVVWPD